MTAPRPREQRRPAAPPDRLPPRRGGYSSSEAKPAAGRLARFVHPSAARALVPAALLAALGALALPATAEAQTNCTLNTGDVWCGVVTVGEETSGATTTGHGFSSTTGASFGTLTDNSGDQTFTYGTETYGVTRVVVSVGAFAGELAFRVRRGSTDVFALADDDRAKLALHVDGSTTPFAFGDTVEHSTRLGYIWRPTGLDWSSATTVTLRLRELPDAPAGFEAAVGNAQVPLTWDEPASGANITRHEFRYKTGDGSYPLTWTQIAASAPGGTNEAGFTVTGLTNEIAHTFELRAVNDSGASAAEEDGPVTPTPGICDRTEQVRDALLNSTGVDDCKAVTVANLAGVTGLILSVQAGVTGITALKSGDFAGLTGLTALVVGGQPGLTTLPADVFSGLSALTLLSLSGNQLGTLPEEVFSSLTALQNLALQQNQLNSLPANVFSGLTALTRLNVSENELTSLDAGVFSSPTALTIIQLNGNNLTATALPGTVFRGLTALATLALEGNDLTSLPDGLFTGLTELTFLDLTNNPNTGDTLPLTVTLEKVGTDQVRAKVPAGAPFAVDFTPTVVNGSLPASVTKLAVAAGAVDGTEVTVTRTSGTTAPVTVDIDLTTQPTLPANHVGYEFVKATSGLPKEILSDDPNEPPVFDPATAEREVPENSASSTERRRAHTRGQRTPTPATRWTYFMDGTDDAPIFRLQRLDAADLDEGERDLRLRGDEEHLLGDGDGRRRQRRHRHRSR